MCSRASVGLTDFCEFFWWEAGETSFFPFSKGPWPLAGSLRWPDFLPPTVPLFPWAPVCEAPGDGGNQWLLSSLEKGISPRGAVRGTLAGRQGAALLGLRPQDASPVLPGQEEFRSLCLMESLGSPAPWGYRTPYSQDTPHPAPLLRHLHESLLPGPRHSQAGVSQPGKSQPGARSG